MNAANPVIDLRGVGRTFQTEAGPVPVLRQVNAQLHAGDFTILTGPSGSGKTTFLNLIALMDQPSVGELFFQGQAVGNLGERERAELRKERIGVVFQRFHLLPGRSVLDNVYFRFRYMQYPVAQAVEQAWQALRVVGLESIARRPARVLSAGEMQRVAIARAIAHPPALLVADEPTGNLDKDSTRAVMECFARLHAEHKMTILLVTHNESLLSYASRHWQCRDGYIVEAGLSKR